jgi:preprotein translocase subunit SecE
MARQTRAQRRARRAETARDGGQAPERPRAAQAAARPARASAAPRAAVAQRQLPVGGARRFVSESWGELKKVEWPGQNQLIQGVAVVLIACLIVGVFLYGADRLFQPLVKAVFT